jgi:hypothetical protein|tara:strand:+ start:5862 stop:7304 length:1443 start_codon:yes stop_codon:yes gene_type:complete
MRVHQWVLDGFLTEYQNEGWDFMFQKDAILWWACGSGKTLAALLWASSQGEPGKTLVITRAPARRQWQREVSHYTTGRAIVGESRTPMPLEEMRDADILILSWDTIPYWIDAIAAWRQATGHLFVVFDELHKGKSWRRQRKYLGRDGNVKYRSAENRAAAACAISRMAHRRLGLTATLIRDRVGDLWGQADLVSPNFLGTNWSFVHRYCDAKPGKFGGLDVSGRSNEEELKKRLAKIVHVVSREEMARKLPPKRRQLVYLSKTDQVRPAGFSAEMKRAARNGVHALFEMRLLEAASRKRHWITETVADAVDAGQKVCVFTGRRKDCEALAKLIGKKLKDAPLWTGHGGDSTQYRDGIVAEYAAHEGAAAFVGTTDAFGESIDGLQNTDLVVFGLLPWTPGQITQAEGRFSRHGSNRSVLIMYTIAQGTVDESVADVLLNKLQAVEAVLDDKESGEVASTLAGDQDEDSIIASILAASAGL